MASRILEGFDYPISTPTMLCMPETDNDSRFGGPPDPREIHDALELHRIEASMEALRRRARTEPAPGPREEGLGLDQVMDLVVRAMEEVNQTPAHISQQIAGLELKLLNWKDSLLEILGDQEFARGVFRESAGGLPSAATSVVRLLDQEETPEIHLADGEAPISRFTVARIYFIIEFDCKLLEGVGEVLEREIHLHTAAAERAAEYLAAPAAKDLARVNPSRLTPDGIPFQTTLGEHYRRYSVMLDQCPLDGGGEELRIIVAHFNRAREGQSFEFRLDPSERERANIPIAEATLELLAPYIENLIGELSRAKN